MRHLRIALLTTLTTLFVSTLCASAQADPNEYGIESVSASASTNQAGAHPDFTISFALKTEKGEGKALPATTRNISIDLPPGLLANPNAAPKCTTAQLTTADAEDPSNKTGCPQDSQIGITEVTLCKSGCGPFNEPIYNMESPGGDVAARLGFIGEVYPIFIDAHLRPDDYGATVTVTGASSFIPLLAASTTTWGAPAAESHDGERITPYEAAHCGGTPCTAPGGVSRPSGLVPTPFMVNPTRCGVAREVKITAASYALPDQPSEAIATLPPVSGCGALEFNPEISLDPTTGAADSPSGMDVELSLPQQGLVSPNLLAESHLRRVVTTLAPGLTLNPAAAAGLGACSEVQIGLVSESPIRFNSNDPSCPASSKVGEARIDTPVLAKPIEGALYLARQDDNPFRTLLSGYLVAQGQGVTIKLAGRFDIDPGTHQIIATFDENPQAPFNKVTLHFKAGSRGVLITPRVCGNYGSQSLLSSWSAKDPANPSAVETVRKTSFFAIDSGPESTICPSGRFDPRLEAGTTNPLAGQFSPLLVRLTRQDGTQRLVGATVSLPPGLTGKLAGIPYCPEGAIASGQARSGLGQGSVELANPSCPPASRIATVVAGAGAGPTPFYVEAGKGYLAGPYKGAPLSLVIVTPAVAGPFDLGTVVVRTALRVDPETAQVSAVSDPLPTFLQGIPLDIRDVRVATNRSDFALNPTSCDETAVEATLTSDGAQTAAASSRFKVGGCKGLGFKPRLSMSLRGKTNRGAHPRFRAVLRPREGDANIAFASVSLPRSEFLDQAHIGTVCTRVQFAAHTCPAASVYGHVRAFSPLLDKPLKGPIYLRSSSHLLPDLVFALHGQLDFNAVARVDSVNGGIRTTFEAVPDAPISKVIVTMQGGAKGLLVNSRNLCRAPWRAEAKLSAHNGRRRTLRPLLDASCATPSRARRSHHNNAALTH